VFASGAEAWAGPLETDDATEGGKVMAEGLTSPWWAFVLLGLGAGILSGGLGIGSGTLLIPVLVLLLSFSQKSAQGTSLAVMVPMALVAAILYQMNPDIHLPSWPIALLALGAIVGALIGAELAHWLPGHTLRTIFAIYIIIVGVRMLWGVRKPEPPPGENAVSAAPSDLSNPGKGIPHASG